MELRRDRERQKSDGDEKGLSPGTPEAVPDMAGDALEQPICHTKSKIKRSEEKRSAEVKLKRTSENHTFGVRAYCRLPDDDPCQVRSTKSILDSILYYFLLVSMPVSNSFGASRRFRNSSGRSDSR